MVAIWILKRKCACVGSKYSIHCVQTDKIKETYQNYTETNITDKL